jgi:hypothetical protein
VKARGVVFSTAVASCWILLWPLFARGSAVDPQSLASSLRRDPVQSIAVPQSDSSLGSIADPVFGDLPAGT